jgi:putative CRISPR-associated protein (TIGR02620 family)
MERLIIARHAGAVEWLRRNGIKGQVVAHVDDPEILEDKHVYGVLPLYLAARARSITEIAMPGLTPEQRGKELTPEEMDEAGARLQTYFVTQVKGV